MESSRPSSPGRVVIVPLELGQVTLPASHPRAAQRTHLLRGYAICHPDGVIVVDTGVGEDNTAINELYRPESIGLIAALNNADIDERSVTAIVNTHLHFDHCGQNHLLPSAPVWVTRAEMAAVTSVRDYTVREWADVPLGRLRYATDGEEIAEGVRLVATPGHSPGHQSVRRDRFRREARRDSWASLLQLSRVC